MNRLAVVIGTIVALASASSALADPERYDLVCKGTQTLETGAAPKAYEERFRINLRDKRWCRGACNEAYQIDQVSADYLYMAESRRTIGGPSGAELRLDRVKGTLTEGVPMGWSGRVASLVEAKCVKDGYSFMPEPKF